MERCPNCGSSVRTGAKFCTTCGFRLPLPASPDVSTSGKRSPFDTTSSDTVMSRWTEPGAPPPKEPDVAVAQAVVTPTTPSPVKEEADAAPSPTAVPVVTDELVERTESATAAPFSGWPGYGTGFGPRDAAWGTDRSPEEAPLPVYPDLPPATPPSTHTVYDAVAAWSAGEELPPVAAGGETGDKTPPSGEHEPPLGGGDLLLQPESSESMAWAWPPDEAAASSVEKAVETAPVVPAAVAEPVDSGDSEHREPEEAFHEPAAAAVLAETGEDETEAAPADGTDDVSPMPVPTTADGPDPIERATALVAELQNLLPLLAQRSPAEDLDLDQIRERLAESLATESSGDEPSFASLRAAVATAQARPRDVDVMLDLMSRADAMAAVIASHDRYKSAIEAAIERLSGQKEESPARRW